MSKKLHKPLSWRLALLVILMIAGAIYFVKNNDGNSSPEELTEVNVRLGWVHQAQFAGMYVALDKGFYEELGLDVNLMELDSNIDQVDELNEGSTDFSVMEAHQALVGVGVGVKITAVMAVYQINPHALGVRADSDIYEPEDFSGKVIGLSGGEGGGNALFRYFLNQFGLEDSITYKNLDFNTVENFINNDADVIDLYSIDQPYLAEERGVPLRVFPLDAYGFSTYGDVIVVNNTLLETDPELVRNFVEATKKGWTYALENQEEAIEITLRYATGDYANEDYEKHILQQSVPLIQGSEPELGHMDFVPWSTLYEAMRSAGVFETEFDIQTIFTNEFINSSK